MGKLVCLSVCAFSETFGKCVLYLASSYLFIHIVLHQIGITIYLLLKPTKIDQPNDLRILLNGYDCIVIDHFKQQHSADRGKFY